MDILITAAICLLPSLVLWYAYKGAHEDCDNERKWLKEAERSLEASQIDRERLRNVKLDIERELKGAREMIEKSNAEIAAYRDEPERYDIYPLDNVVHVVAYHKGYMSIVRSFRHDEHGESYAVMRAIETVEFLTDYYR